MRRLRVVEVIFRCTQSTHDRVEDTELSSSERTDHDATRQETDRTKADDAGFRGDGHQTLHHGTFSAGSRFVDLGKQGIRGVRNDGGGHSGYDTGTQRDPNIGTAGKLGGGLAHGGVDSIGDLTLDGKLGHGVRDLLGEDGDESRVEPANTFVLQNLSEAVSEAVAELRVRNGTDAHGLQRAEEDISDELGGRGGAKVNIRLIIPRLLLPHHLHGLDFEELHAAEFKPTLYEIAEGGGAKASGQGHGALLGHDLTHPPDESGVVLDRVQLHAGLDDVDGTEGAVRDGTADATGGGGLDVVH